MREAARKCAGLSQAEQAEQGLGAGWAALTARMQAPSSVPVQVYRPHGPARRAEYLWSEAYRERQQRLEEGERRQRALE